MENNKLSYWLFASLLCVFTIRCWISLFPILNIPFVSTVLGGMTVYMPLITFSIALYSGQVKVNTADQRNLVVMFLIYILYCAHYIANPQTLEAQAAPDTVGQLLYKSMPLFLMMCLSGECLKFCDITLFAKISTVLILIFLFAYFSHFSIFLYTIGYELTDSEADALLPDGFLGSLALSGYISVAYCANLYSHDKWTNTPQKNKLITISIAIVLFVIQFMLVERGPILGLLTVTLFHLLCKKIIKGKSFIILAIVVLLLLFLFQDIILDILSGLSEATIQKFKDTTDNGANGRFGSGDALFPSAIRQISEAPLFGSYYRCLYGGFKGGYPHNFILEFLMSFGIFFSIPLFFLMYKAIRKSYKCPKAPWYLFSLLFFNRVLFHLTSGTVLGDNIFWLSFAIIMAANINIENINHYKYE